MSALIDAAGGMFSPPVVVTFSLGFVTLAFGDWIARIIRANPARGLIPGFLRIGGFHVRSADALLLAAIAASAASLTAQIAPGFPEGAPTFSVPTIAGALMLLRLFFPILSRAQPDAVMVEGRWQAIFSHRKIAATSLALLLALIAGEIAQRALSASMPWEALYPKFGSDLVSRLKETLGVSLWVYFAFGIAPFVVFRRELGMSVGSATLYAMVPALGAAIQAQLNDLLAVSPGPDSIGLASSAFNGAIRAATFWGINSLFVWLVLHQRGLSTPNWGIRFPTAVAAALLSAMLIVGLSLGDTLGEFWMIRFALEQTIVVVILLLTTRSAASGRIGRLIAISGIYLAASVILAFFLNFLDPVFYALPSWGASSSILFWPVLNAGMWTAAAAQH